MGFCNLVLGEAIFFFKKNHKACYSGWRFSLPSNALFQHLLQLDSPRNNRWMSQHSPPSSPWAVSHCDRMLPLFSPVESFPFLPSSSPLSFCRYDFAYIPARPSGNGRKTPPFHGGKPEVSSGPCIPIIVQTKKSGSISCPASSRKV